MKRFIRFILLIFLLSGCHNYNKIEVGNITVSSIEFKNTTTMSIDLAAHVNNPVDKNLVIESFDAVLYNEGKAFASFTLVGNPIAEANKRTVVPIEIEARAIDHIAIISMGLNYKSWNIDAMTVTGKLVLKFEDGGKRTIKVKNKSLKSIMRAVK